MGYQGIDERQAAAPLVFRDTLVDASGNALSTGTTTLFLYELQADGTLNQYDWSTNTFKGPSASYTSPTVTMTHRVCNSVNTGIWTKVLSDVSDFVVGNIYIATITHSAAIPKRRSRQFQFGADGEAILAKLSTTTKIYAEPWEPNLLRLIRGDAYNDSARDTLSWTAPKDMGGWAVTLTVRSVEDDSVLLAVSGSATASTIAVALTAAQTASLAVGRHKFDVQSSSGTSIYTIALGWCDVLEDQTR